MTAVGGRADVTTVGRVRHVADVADETATAQVLNLAVPGALAEWPATAATVSQVQRETHAQNDALDLAGRVTMRRSAALGDGEVDATVGAIVSGRRYERGCLGDDRRVARQPEVRIGRKFGAAGTLCESGTHCERDA